MVHDRCPPLVESGLAKHGFPPVGCGSVHTPQSAGGREVASPNFQKTSPCKVGERGWIVLTRDKRIRYRSQERTALIQARVRAFVLSGGNLSAPAMAEACVQALPAMRRFVARYEAPFIACVTQTGSVSLLLKP